MHKAEETFESQNASDLIEQLFCEGILAEIHKFLWIEPFNNKGSYDAGWSCRDHAFISSCLLAARGISARIVTGKCMFVRGPMNGRPPCGYGQDATHKNAFHTWLEIDEYGVLDFSPNLDGSTIPLTHWTTIPFKGIFGSKWVPEDVGDFMQCESESSFSNQIARCSYNEGAIQAIYWPQKREKLAKAMFLNTFDFVNSPLTDYLRRNFSSNIYSKAVLHFLERIDGKKRSLATVSRNKAWKIIAESQSNSVDDLLK